MTIKDIFSYKPQKEYDFNIQLTSKSSVLEKNIEKIQEKVSSDLEKNLIFLKCKYNTLINSDVVIRNFSIICNDKEYKSFIIYIDGMANSDLINHYILKPLMLRNMNNTFKHITPIEINKNKNDNLSDYIYERLVPQNNITLQVSFEKIISDINSGNSILFIESLNSAFDIDVKGFKQRNVDKPRYRKRN